MRWWPILLLLLAPFPSGAQETIPRPGQSALDRAGEAEASAAVPPVGEAGSEESAPAAEPPGRPFETVVSGPAPRAEERPTGPYGQPEWSTRRRFPTTRIYVAPPGAARLEFWHETRLFLRDAVEPRFRTQYELELGLGHRLQLDVYLTTQQKGLAGDFALHREKVELRWALADWGRLPANPTLYVEAIRQRDGPPIGEVKLLLGDQLRPRLYWGANLVFERELGGARQAQEYAAVAGLAFSVVDRELSIGAELKAVAVDARGSRGRIDEVELYLGPSLQWRPLPAIHVDLVVLAGAVGERGADGFEWKGALVPLVVVGWGT